MRVDFQTSNLRGQSVDRFSLTKKVICDQTFLPAKSQHLVAGFQDNMGQSTHHRLDRLQIVSVGSLRDQSTTQFHVEAHHTLKCVSLNGVQLKTSQVIDSPSVIKQQERILQRVIVDIKTIQFVFSLILYCWRVFSLGSPALRNVGTDRLQMVGVRSLHVDRSWLLVSQSSSESGLQCSTPDNS